MMPFDVPLSLRTTLERREKEGIFLLEKEEEGEEDREIKGRCRKATNELT